MNNPEEILITIDLDGTAKIEAKGVKGTGCVALTAFLEEALGHVVADEKKPEYELQAFKKLGASATETQKNIAKQ